MNGDLQMAVGWLLIVLVLAAAAFPVVATYQFVLVAAHFKRNHYRKCAPYFPRTAVLVPAWNEAAVIGHTIDRLMAFDYPPQCLRVYLIDDASTDDTPAVVRAKVDQYPGHVVYLRRDHGGQGKSHTLNHGLRAAFQDEWMEAVLIMDADVLYEPTALRKMTRHLADDKVGAVTAYIKEGSRPGNYLNRFVAYEYVTAQAAARRGQNVIGAVACLAGGAQLHSRANLEALGGQIDTTSLAEDTFTTMKTQLAGRTVVFEPQAIVWAEEPHTIEALWKQRVRWARGNVQATKAFSDLWFRRSKGHAGGVAFGLFWFAVLLLPLVMVLASASLVALFFLDFKTAWIVFRALWIINVVSYVFITSFALMIDPEVARRCWREAVLFPGLISLVIIAYTCFPKLFAWLVRHGASAVGIRVTVEDVRWLILFAFVWLAACMLVALCAKLVEGLWIGRVLSPLIVYVGGYGPLLCCITFAAYIKELRGAELRWEKTEKTGRAVMPT